MYFYCFFFFFSSRRRHTRYWRDWSSDVCSSDLVVARDGYVVGLGFGYACRDRPDPDLGDEIGRASCREKSVDLGGRRIIKKKNLATCGCHGYAETGEKRPGQSLDRRRHQLDFLGLLS